MLSSLFDSLAARLSRIAILAYDFRCSYKSCYFAQRCSCRSFCLFSFWIASYQRKSFSSLWFSSSCATVSKFCTCSTTFCSKVELSFELTFLPVFFSFSYCFTNCNYLAFRVKRLLKPPKKADPSSFLGCNCAKIGSIRDRSSHPFSMSICPISYLIF